MSRDPVADAVAALPPLRETIAAAGFKADKRLGQHFLFDLNLTRRIARAGGPLEGGTVIEIGPGPGGLTRALLIEGAAHLIAIDRDPRAELALAPLRVLAGPRLALVIADAMAVDLTGLGTAPRRIVANLPYNVGTKLVTDWLEQAGAFAAITVMLQKEVALRLAAKPGDDAYGRLAVLAGATARVQRLFDVPPSAFVPPPTVESSVLRIDPLPDQPAPARLAALKKVTEAAFGQRRKMLRQSLRRITPDTENFLGACEVPPTARAEELTVEEFMRLADALRGG